MKYKFLFHPEDFCIGENERFYSEQAAQGWRLSKRGRYLSRFIRSEPVEELYRIEMEYEEMTGEQLSLYEECGWKYVTKRGYVNVFRAPAGSGAPEFYSDPVEQAQTIRRIRRRDRAASAVGFVILGLWLAVIFSVGRGSDWLFGGLALRLLMIPEILAAYAAAMIYFLALDAESSVRFRRMIRRLKSGQSLDHSPKRRRMVHAYVLLAFELACVLTTAAQLVLYSKSDMPRVSDGPYVTLAELGFDGERRGILDMEPEAEVERVWSPLCDIVMAEESVEAAGSWASLDQDIYDLRVSSMAKDVLKPLMRTSHFNRDPEDYVRVTLDGWDEVWVDYWECWARSGGRIVRLYIMVPNDYVPGGVTLDDKTELFARTLTLIAKRE